MTDLEKMALNAFRRGIRWRLDGEPCWCDCERRAAWKADKKKHTTFCVQAGQAYSALLDAEKRSGTGFYAAIQPCQ